MKLVQKIAETVTMRKKKKHGFKKGDKVVIKGENSILEIADIFGDQVHFGPCHPPVHASRLMRVDDD